MINEQTAWLGVPAVQVIACGHVRTDLPMSRRALIAMAVNAPWLLKYLPQPATPIPDMSYFFVDRFQ